MGRICRLIKRAYARAGTAVPPPPPDTSPDDFSFPELISVPRETLVASISAQVKGITGPTPISIDYGEYRIDGGPWTSAAGVVVNNQNVEVHHISGDGFSEPAISNLSVGDKVVVFKSTTLAIDLLPDDDFSFVTQDPVPIDTDIASNIITVHGINAPTLVTSDALISINGGAFVSSGYVDKDQTLQALLRSSVDYETVARATMNIGGLVKTFDVKTGVAPAPTPTPTPSISIAGTFVNGQQGTAYSSDVTPSGGTPPYTLVVDAATELPPGYTLTIVGGKPTLAGTDPD